MSRIHRVFRGQGEELLVDGTKQGGCITLLKVRATARPDQQDVSGEHAFRLVAHVTDAAIGVSGSFPDFQLVLPEAYAIPLLHQTALANRARALGHDGSAPRARPKRAEGGDVIGVNVRIQSGD